MKKNASIIGVDILRSKGKKNNNNNNNNKNKNKNINNKNAESAQKNNKSDPHAFWKSFKDEDFYNHPGLQHIYFYKEVSEESVMELRENMQNAAKMTQTSSNGMTKLDPKPIVLHVCTLGGSLLAGAWFFNLFARVSVPICVLVEGASASAGTFLSICAPYRIMHANAFTLIHQFSMTMKDSARMKRSQLLHEIDLGDNVMRTEKQLLLRKTKMTEDYINHLMLHDLWLHAEECLKQGICDRVIFASSSQMQLQHPDRMPLFETSWNTIYNEGDYDTAMALDKKMQLSHKEDGISKPIVFMTPRHVGVLHSEHNFDSLTILPRIQAITPHTPLYTIIDNVIGWWDLIPTFFSAKTYMYEGVFMDVSMNYDDSIGYKLGDIIHNSQTIRDMIYNLVCQRMESRNIEKGKRLTRKTFEDMLENKRFLDAHKCLELGFVDEIIPL